MSTLVIGFDSAWTEPKKGALAAIAVDDDGRASVVIGPRAASFEDAGDLVEQHAPSHRRVLVMLDQPTIVPNMSGCRPVERIVSSPVSRARGGVQPANRQRVAMFGAGAPVWRFLDRVGGSLDPADFAPRRVVETYPVLALIALGWLRNGSSLPKYNPERPTYTPADWIWLCERLRDALADRGLPELAAWCEEAGNTSDAASRAVRKALQDQVDALICLVVGLDWCRGEATLQVGSVASGLIVVPGGPVLRRALEERLDRLGWGADAWVRELNEGTAIP